MASNFSKRLPLALCAMIFLGGPAQAGLTDFKPADGPSESVCRDGLLKKTSIMLQSSDQRRIELARSYTQYLKNKGQDPRIIRSIYRASLKSGVDFELLLLKAIMESDLGRQNVAATSSARGAYQYIEPTWLILMKRYGAHIGYPHYAQAIDTVKYSGIPYIKNRNAYLKAEILALRHDPEVSALIKAYQIKEETEIIQRYKGGKKVTATDHYITHMLGLSLAREFYDLKEKNSVLAVAYLNKPEMREAARLNRSFFFEGQRPLTAKESYKKFKTRVDRELKKIQNVSNIKFTASCSDEKLVSKMAGEIKP